MTNDEFDEAELRVLRQHVQALSRDIAPATEAWAKIRDRIEHGRVHELVPPVVAHDVSASHDVVPATVRATVRTTVPAMVPAMAPATNVPFTQNPAAREALNATPGRRAWLRSTRGVALIAATVFFAVTTFVVQHRRAAEPVSAAPLASVTPRPDMAGVFARYDGAATELANDLDRRRSRLNPTVVAVLDSCLSTLDQAIHETQSALDAAPDNATIAGLLEVTYQQKLDLLRRASELSEGTFQD